MPGLRFEVILSGWRSNPDLYTAAYIKPWLKALVESNVVYLRSHPGTPSILDPICGVRYRREKGTEQWRDIPTILRDKYGDCEDLACAHVAELICRGIPAKVIIKAGLNRNGGRLFHILCGVGRNRIDPSKMLGMNGEGLQMSDGKGGLIALLALGALGAAAYYSSGKANAAEKTPSGGGIDSPIAIPKEVPPLPVASATQAQVRGSLELLLTARDAFRKLPANLSAIASDLYCFANPQAIPYMQQVANWFASNGYPDAAKVITYRAAEATKLASLPVIFVLNLDANLPLAARMRLLSLTIEQRWDELSQVCDMVAGSYPKTVETFRRILGKVQQQTLPNVPKMPAPPVPGTPGGIAIPGGIPTVIPAIPGGVPAMPVPPVDLPPIAPSIPPPRIGPDKPAGQAPPPWWPKDVPWVTPQPGKNPADSLYLPKGASWDADKGQIAYIVQSGDYSAQRIAERFQKENPALWSRSAVVNNPGKKWGQGGNVFVGTKIYLQPEWGIKGANPPVDPAFPEANKPAAAKPKKTVTTTPEKDKLPPGYVWVPDGDKPRQYKAVLAPKALAVTVTAKKGKRRCETIVTRGISPLVCISSMGQTAPGGKPLGRQAV